MSKDDSTAEKIAQVFEGYCKRKKYQVKRTEKPDDDLRLDISDLKSRTIVNIYHTSKIVIQGSQNALRAEMEDLKQTFEANTGSFIIKEPVSKACSTRYDIMLPELRELVKANLEDVRDVKIISISDKPTASTEYTAKVQRQSYSVSITQYINGTLLLQGKDDALFDDCCSLIESRCNPSEKEVISRFISSDEECLKVFVAKYTPELIELAEIKTREALGIAYDYLEPYDQKWFVASECISMTEIPLPEYSPVVMPASKALEGFAKKLLVDIGLFPQGYFDKKSNFASLKDHNHPSRKAICEKDKHADSFLEKLAVCLDMSRNFMMHSDDAKVTKIESPQEAREKLDSIFRDAKEIFEYFNDIYKLR